MRYYQFITENTITEIGRIKDIAPDDTIDTGWNNSQDIADNSKKLPGNNPWRYSVIEGLGDYTIFMADPTHNEVIGKLDIEEIQFPLKRAGRSNYIMVHRDYGGHGIAKSLYGIWLSILKRPLVSGTMQTSAGRRAWLSLNNIPGVHVKGYIKIADAVFGSEYIEDYQDRIMATGAQYIGQDRSDHHYFSFDVKPNGDLGELEAVYNKAMTLYDGSDYYITVGLYAIWTGR